MTAAAPDHPDLVRLPLDPYEIAIAGRVWSLGIVRDEHTQLNFSADRARFPFGLMIWESARVLADVMSEMDLAGAKVIELGCGVGLPGFVAASRGASVTMTDHDPLALALAAQNARRNGLTGIRFEVADWHDWRVSGQFDLVIGADVIYDTGDYEALAALFARIIRPGGRVLMTDPNRQQTIALLTLLEDVGWTFTIEQRRTAEISGGTDGSGSVDVQVISLTRP